MVFQAASIEAAIRLILGQFLFSSISLATAWHPGSIFFNGPMLRTHAGQDMLWSRQMSESLDPDEAMSDLHLYLCLEVTISQWGVPSNINTFYDCFIAPRSPYGSFAYDLDLVGVCK